jgi:hypothetical protein
MIYHNIKKCVISLSRDDSSVVVPSAAWAMPRCLSAQLEGRDAVHYLLGKLKLGEPNDISSYTRRRHSGKCSSCDRQLRKRRAADKAGASVAKGDK